MPPPALPPTPGSSTDIRGKESFYAIAPALALPPTAFTQGSDRATSSPLSSNGSDSSYHPASPASPHKTLRRHAAATTSQVRGTAKGDDAFTLPPPPTRSRKIIQMKPKGSSGEAQQRQQQQKQPQQRSELETDAVKGTASTAGGKKRGGNANSTAAGRKIARKTAHSLIERRRRSKMNEEFGVLKDMIPACNGQEMHKLAILQASIEYLRYLERCIVDLKAQNDMPKPSSVPCKTPSIVHQAEVDMEHDSDSDEAMSEDDDDNDVKQHAIANYNMKDSDNNNTTNSAASNASLPQTHSRTSLPPITSLPSISHFTTQSASPSILATDHSQHRHYSISSVSQASFSPYLHSTQTSPYFGPSYSTGSTAQDPGAFVLTSPALKPQDAGQQQQHHHYHHHHHHQQPDHQQQQQAPQQLGVSTVALTLPSSPSSSSSAAAAAAAAAAVTTAEGSRWQRDQRLEQDLDKEAMAALLMLNSDRRNWKDSSGRAMSVQDLLSN